MCHEPAQLPPDRGIAPFTARQARTWTKAGTNACWAGTLMTHDTPLIVEDHGELQYERLNVSHMARAGTAAGEGAPPPAPPAGARRLNVPLLALNVGKDLIVARLYRV